MPLKQQNNLLINKIWTTFKKRQVHNIVYPFIQYCVMKTIITKKSASQIQHSDLL